MDSKTLIKRRSFIPKSLRPDVVGARISVSNAQSGLKFYNEFANLDISSLKDFTSRKKLIVQIFNFSESFFDDNTKKLVKILQGVAM